MRGEREVIDRPSPNCEPRPARTRIDMLLLHYTGMESTAAALERLCDPDAKVSAHYLIDEDGTLYRLVDEAMRAWHAGVAEWEGEPDVNSRSIGIELANPGHELGYRDFPEPQIARLEVLARGIVERYDIAPARVLGHSDVAPMRKTDPGERFPWGRLARAGVGLWPERLKGGNAAEFPPLIARVQELLSRFGYQVPRHGKDDAGTRAAIAALQRHWRPKTIDGVADCETVAILQAVLAAKEAAGAAAAT